MLWVDIFKEKVTQVRECVQRDRVERGRTERKKERGIISFLNVLDSYETL